jgi:phosphoglycerol transferase MdoB-like AlkP superfamily enzyme
MAQRRDTLVKTFGRHGYRTVAIMPGLLRSWPQGSFFGFEAIYDRARLDYHGPPFGWWDINDQFALARADALEIAPLPRRPAFIFFPTITTHAPFTPTPPYQAEWTRVLTPHPYDAADLNRAWSQQPDWLNLGPGYIHSLVYAYATLGGYLRLRADRDLVVILLGDHQPPALVSGPGASWEVPVHVIASRPGVLDRLRQHRFRDGLVPRGPAVARMDMLLAILLDAFGDEEHKLAVGHGAN